MIGKVFDGFIAVIFMATALFGTTVLYNVVRREALIRVSRGLSSTYRYTQRLTGGGLYDWERKAR